MTRRITTTALLSTLLTTSTAFATPVMIDFTSQSWSGAEGQTVYTQTYGGLEVTLSASGPMTFNAAESNGQASGSLAMLGDGIGIGDDEISFNGSESIDVLFSSNVTVLGYYFLDFFSGEGPGGLVGELATVTLGPTELYHEAVGTDALGYYGHDGLSITTNAISFGAGWPVDEQALSTFASNIGLLGNLNGLLGFSDFSLAGILIDDGLPGQSVRVPEPGSLALLLGGLLGLGGLHRTRRRR